MSLQKTPYCSEEEQPTRGRQWRSKWAVPSVLSLSVILRCVKNKIKPYASSFLWGQRSNTVLIRSNEHNILTSDLRAEYNFNLYKSRAIEERNLHKIHCLFLRGNEKGNMLSLYIFNNIKHGQYVLQLNFPRKEQYHELQTSIFSSYPHPHPHSYILV